MTLENVLSHDIKKETFSDKAMYQLSVRLQNNTYDREGTIKEFLGFDATFEVKHRAQLGNVQANICGKN